MQANLRINVVNQGYYSVKIPMQLFLQIKMQPGMNNLSIVSIEIKS